MARSRVAGPCFPLAGAARNSRCDSRPLIWLSLPRRDWPLSSRTRPPPVGRDQRLLATCSLILRAGTSFLTRLAGSWRRMFKCRPRQLALSRSTAPPRAHPLSSRGLADESATESASPRRRESPRRRPRPKTVISRAAGVAAGEAVRARVAP